MNEIDYDKLDEPFPLRDIEFKIGATYTHEGKKYGLAMPHVTARAVQDRLDKVCGRPNWENRFQRWGDKGVLCGIRIRVNGGWVTKWDGAEETDFESVKGGLSGAEKRACVQWGIGRYLYSLEAVWVELDAKGRIKNKLEPYDKIKPNYPKGYVGDNKDFAKTLVDGETVDTKTGEVVGNGKDDKYKLALMAEICERWERPARRNGKSQKFNAIVKEVCGVASVGKIKDYEDAKKLKLYMEKLEAAKVADKVKETVNGEEV